MSRKSDILQKLNYADFRFQEMAAKIFDAGFAGSEIRFLSLLSPDILASCREVFDYCARDIAESYGLIDKDGKCYYPFFKTQLTRSKSAFYRLKEKNKPLHDHLFRIASAIEKKKIHEKTILNYGILEDLNNMVNQKKHDKLLLCQSSDTHAIYAKSRETELIIPSVEQKNVSNVRLSPDAKHRVGNQYVFEYNKRDIMFFAMSVKQLSRLVMKNIYDTYLS